MAKTIRKVTPTKLALPKRLRVAAYARVSTGKDAMLHSLSAQVSHYSSFIQKNPQWSYAGVYADEATTGTKENRSEFQRMLSDCRSDKIDMIITKSISRFARNTVTLLETVRELKSLGVDVYFEEQNIHTMSGDGELMLTILASYAQEESRSISENCKWRIRENFKRGIPSTTRLNGYTINHGTFTIIPDEANIIRLIFECYLSGMGKNAITRALNDAGIPTKNGAIWHESVIEAIIRNEKYQGDLLLQKHFRIDHLTKQDRPNRGELPQYYVANNHEAIISRETFMQTQECIEQRASHYNNGQPPNAPYPYTGKIICGNCGKPYRRRHNSGKITWQCSTYVVRGKKYCAAKHIREDVLEQLSAKALAMQDFNPDIFNSKVDHLVIYNDQRLVFHFSDGHEATYPWQNPSRRESWTPEMKAQASLHAHRRYTHE